MKKNLYKIRFTLALFVAMLLGATNVQAQTSYNLWICGTRVTTDNCDDLTVIDGVSVSEGGYATYTPANNTLNLKNATFNVPGNNKGINSHIEGLIIEVVGNDSINGNGWSLVELYDSATILGGGTLTVTNLAPDNAIICHKSLIIKNCTINATSNQRGIAAWDDATITIDSAFVKAFGAEYGILIDNSHNFTINNSTVIAKGANYGSICSSGNIILNGCFFSKPVDAQILYGTGVCDAYGNIIKDTVKIEPIIQYDLWIWGTQVTSANCGNLAAIAGATEGIMTYDNSTKTLKLENLKIDKSGNLNIIRSSIDELKIEVVGENNLKNAGWSIIDVDKNTTILGSGTLNIENTNDDFGIYVDASATLTIKDCKLNVYCLGVGIHGWGSEYLIIDNAIVTAKGAYRGSIVGFTDITFNGCAIFKPDGAVFNSSMMAICDADGNIIKDTVRIAPVYDLWICGTRVTVDNCDNLTVIDGVSVRDGGYATYTHATKTLNLKNATFNAGSNEGIDSHIEGLIIEAVGNDSINGNNPFSLVELYDSTTILGEGTLTVTNLGDVAISCYKPLFIKNCTVNATSNFFSIYARHDATVTIDSAFVKAIGEECGIFIESNHNLTINNSTVIAKGLGGSIRSAGNIILNDCVFSKPMDAQILNGIGVCDAEGTRIKDTVMIVPGKSYDLWVWGAQVTTVNSNNLAAVAGASEGSMTYDNSTKTLTLDNVNINKFGNRNIIKSSIDGLKIEVVGENNLKNNGWSIIDVSKNTTIQGNDTLNIENTYNDYGINVTASATLTIKDCHFNIASLGEGIHGSGNDSLVFDSATVTAKGSNAGSIVGFTDITFNGCAIFKPDGAVFNSSVKAICDADGNIIKDTVRIAPVYDLWICGTRVTVDNCDNLTVIGGVSVRDGGYATYTPATKTLNLKNATFNVPGGNRGIKSEIEGLIIEVVGNDSINGNSFSTLVDLYNSTTILGEGTLTVTNLIDVAIGCKKPLYIKNCTVNATSDFLAIEALDNVTIDSAFVKAISEFLGIFIGNDHNLLTINNSTVIAKGGGGSGSICCHGNIILNDCVFSKPMDAQILNGIGVCDADGNPIWDTVKIVPGKSYDLWVWGAQVTTINYNNLAAIAGATEGSMTYDNSTKTLMLENVNINKSGNRNIIKSSIDGLKIEVVGENNLKNNGLPIIEVNKNTTIQGNDTLNIENTKDDYGINVTASATLTIKDCKLNVSCLGAGIHGSGNDSLVFDSATVTAKGSNAGSIVGFTDITFNGCDIFKPAGAVFNSSVKAICDADGNIIKDTVRIAPVYDLWICGTRVTVDNCDNLTVIDGVSVSEGGYATYTPATKTLNLKNATFNAGSNNGINSQIEGLIIEVVGNDSINGNSHSPLVDLYNSTTILGEGTLTVTNLMDVAIGCKKPLYIKNCTVNATSDFLAIKALDNVTIDSAFVKAIGEFFGIFIGNNNNLTINNSTVIAKGGGGFGSIISSGNIILNDCVFSKPMDAQILSGVGVCNADGNLIDDTVKIVPGKSYDLWVWGAQVTTINSNNLAAVAGASEGSMTYDNSTKTLMLENVKIDTLGNRNIIKSSIDGLKIEVVGENNLKNNGWSIIDVSKNTTIQGNDTLNIENTYNDYGINVTASATLTIKDCKLNVSCLGSGIHGSGNDSLVFDSATVTAKGSNAGSIVGFTDITFNDCFISQPVGAVFESSEYAICNLFGEITSDTVKILPGTAYDLWIWTTRVTEDNCGNLAAIAGATEGSMTYDNSTKTLTLDNVKIDKVGGINIIRSYIDELKIEIVGENNLRNDGWSLIDVSNNTTIQGSGTLNIENSIDNIGINVNVLDTLTIKDCKLNVASLGEGIRGGGSEKLIIDNAIVTVRGVFFGSIVGFTDITFNGCAIFKPLGAVFNPEKKAICDADRNIITDTVRIAPVYDLWICGTRVTVDNCDNLTVIDGVSVSEGGYATYTHATKTLNLKNATFNAPGNEIGIYSQIEGLIIGVVGNDSINGNSFSTLVDLYNSTTILGEGTLTVTNLGDFAISCNKQLSIKKCTVNATGNFLGIEAWGNATITIDSAFVKAIGTDYGIYIGNDHNLTINNSTVIAKGLGGSIRSHGNIILNDCVFSKPMDAQILNGTGVCNAEGTIIKDTVMIVPGKSYDLWVWGAQVTTVNSNNLAAVAGASEGSMTYDNSTKTLMLDNVKIDTLGDRNIIKSSIDGLKIEVVGENNLRNDGWSLIDVNNNTTIQGSGTLNIENIKDDNIGINVNVLDTLTIKDCKLNVASLGAGIRGCGSGSEKLIIDNAIVTVRGVFFGSIVGFTDITFNGCDIVKPLGAVFNSSKKAICDAEGYIITDTVRIAPVYDLWICGTRVTVDNCDNLTVIDGVSVRDGGYATYTPATKTLNLKNATFNAGSNNGINSHIEGLTIEVVGNDSINGNNPFSLVELYDSTTILGEGTLTVTNLGDVAIFCYKPLFIKNCTVNATSNFLGIYALNNAAVTIDSAFVKAIGTDYGIYIQSNHNLTINNSTVIAKGAGGSILCDRDIILNDCVFSKPMDAQILNGTGVCNAEGTIIKDTVMIVPGKSYDLWVWGAQVTTINSNNLAAVAGASEGSMTYDNSTKTLMLENVNINKSGNRNIIKSSIDGLKIEVIGENNLKNNGLPIIEVNKNTTIQGNDTLNIENTKDDYGINVTASATLTIKDCHLNVTSVDAGIRGNNDDNLVFDSATVMVKGINSGSIVGFKDITFTDCAIIKPAGAVFNNTANAICDENGNVIKDTVKIVPTYIISFNSNGGTAVENVTVAYGYSLSEPEAPTKEGYTFVGWFTDTELQNEYDFNLAVTSSFTLYAKWDINSYVVTIAEGITKGSLSFIPASPVVFGETVTITATADDGYKLKDGSLRAYKTGEETEEVPLNGMTFEMPAFDVTITAAFEEIPIEQFTITFATPENGTLSVTLGATALVSGDKVDKNSEIIITATPDDGYKLKTLTVNGNPFESGNTHIVVADVNIVAEFVETSIEDFAAHGIIIYPNPVKDILHIKADETITAVSIYNMQGAIIVQNTGDVREINISSLPAGIYMLRVEMGESASAIQIVKE